MKVALTGYNGFLAKKLRECSEIQWVEETDNADAILHLGSPTFTHGELTQHDAQVMHQYVKESMRIIDRFDGPVIFASTTGTDDIQLDHSGSTAYNLGKLFLENYVINNADKYLILRIGTIVSKRLSDIKSMRSDRVQPRILKNDFSNIEDTDHYLDVDVFVEVTINAILNSHKGILTYPLTKLTRTELLLYGRNL